VQPSPLQQRLCEAFGFDAADLDANRSGRLSPRQEARLRAANAAARFSLLACLVLTAGGAAFAGAGAGGVGLVAAGLAAALVGTVAVLASRSSLATLRSLMLVVAEGRAEPVGGDRLRVGPTLLRLGAPGQCEAFEPGLAYRVFLFPGRRALVLSAEPLGTQPERR